MSEEFEYFDGYLVDFIDDKISNGKPIATTKICHDSCVAFDGMSVLIQEAKSGPDNVELLKLLIGLCRMFPYTNKPVGWLSSSEIPTFVLAELNNQRGVVEYTHCFDSYNDVNSFDRMNRVQKTLELIKRLSGILSHKEVNVDGYKLSCSCTRNNPQKKSKQVYKPLTSKKVYLQ